MLLLWTCTHTSPALSGTRVLDSLFTCFALLGEMPAGFDTSFYCLWLKRFCVSTIHCCVEAAAFSLVDSTQRCNTSAGVTNVLWLGVHRNINCKNRCAIEKVAFSPAP